MEEVGKEERAEVKVKVEVEEEEEVVVVVELMEEKKEEVEVEEGVAMRRRALCQKRAYSRWSTACSAPPTYRSTGSQLRSASAPTKASLFAGSAKRR